MKANIVLFVWGIIFLSCSNSVEYSEALKKETKGNYLYNLDEVIKVYYDDGTLLLNWKGGTIRPVALSENEFFIPDLYNKYRFVIHPKTNERYLSILSEDDENAKITYDYIKVADNYKTPSTLLSEGNYEAALKGFLKIKAEDSTSSYIKESYFNRLGYSKIREKDYEKAIIIFKLNTVLHPTSANVYDSLADGYLRRGDSLQAYNNYKKSLDFNYNNKRAKKYVDAYKISK